MSFHVRPDCRLCNGPIQTVLDLGRTALANEYLDNAEAALAQDTFQLYLAQCEKCGHVQLPVVVDPERLFRHYAYQSGTSPVFRQHLSDFANAVQPKSCDALIVEFGSNDGTLLAEYQRRGFTNVLGVDPARNLVEAANAEGRHSVCGFFDMQLARWIQQTRGHAELIIANNVFAHADDLQGITRAVKHLLAPGGRFVFEVGYLQDVIADGLFDVIYHEHTSYHTLTPLAAMLEAHGLRLCVVHNVDSQGGSVRCFAMHTADAGNLGRSSQWDERPDVGALAEGIACTRTAVSGFLRNAYESGQEVWGYGCPAKFTTLAAVCGITRDDVHFIIEDNPLKHGKFTPGTGIPILPMPPEDARPECFPDVFIIFAWNFAEDIARRLRSLGFTGRIVTPLPELREL